MNFDVEIKLLSITNTHLTINLISCISFMDENGSFCAI